MCKTLVAKPSLVQTVSTGSTETERAIMKIIDFLSSKADSWDMIIPAGQVHTIIDRDQLKILHFGRAGTGERREGSVAADDLGDYLARSTHGYKVTDKLIASCR